MGKQRKIWIVFVRGVGAEHVALVHRCGFYPTKHEGVFSNRFDSLKHALAAINPIKAAGLHGLIRNKWVDAPQSARRAPKDVLYPRTTRTSGYSVGSRNPKNPRLRGRGRRGM